MIFHRKTADRCFTAGLAITGWVFCLLLAVPVSVLRKIPDRIIPFMSMTVIRR